MRITLLLALATGACSVDVPTLSLDAPDPIDAAPADDDAMIDAAPDMPPAIVLESPVDWNSGESAKSAGSDERRFCFLQVVQGKLKAAGESLGVTILDKAWVINGIGSDQHAQIRCVTFVAGSGFSVSPAFAWTQGEAPVDMGSADDRICALSTIGGHYNGGGELVRARIENGRWLLDGTSNSGGVRATAYCLGFPAGTTYSGEALWAQDMPAVALEPDDGQRACVFTLITGGYLGGAEHVDIASSGGSWLLFGGSAQQGVAARARCFAWP